MKDDQKSKISQTNVESSLFLIVEYDSSHPMLAMSPSERREISGMIHRIEDGKAAMTSS